MKKILIIISSLILITILAFGGYVFYQIHTLKKMSRGNLITNDFIEQISFQRNNGHIVIEATLNGKKGLFYLDSGAGNILFKNRIETSSFNKIGNLSSTDASGKKMEMDVVSIPSLKIGNVAFQDLSFKLIDGFDFQCTEGIVGIIGYSTMHHMNWQIDYKNQIIICSDKLDKLDVSGDKMDLKINKYTYEPQIALYVNDSTQIYFTFDTGNAGSISADLNSFEQISYENKFLFKGGKQSGLASTNKKEFRDSTVYKLSSKLKLGNTKLEKTIINYNNPKALNLIGNQVLGDYLVTMSWSEKAVWLKKSKTATLNLFNFEYHKIGKKWFISAIEENLQSKYNIVPGDEILEVNGINVIKQNLCEPFPENTLFTIYSQSKKDTINIKLLDLISKR